MFEFLFETEVVPERLRNSPVVGQRQQRVQTLDVTDRRAARLLLVTEGLSPAVFFSFADPLPQLPDLPLHPERREKTSVSGFRSIYI